MTRRRRDWIFAIDQKFVRHLKEARPIGRRTGLALRLLIAVLVLTLHLGTATADDVTIDFDTFPDSSSVPAGTVITTQYASLGVTFSSTAPAGGPTAVSDNEASSPPNHLSGLDPNTGAGLFPIVMDLAGPLPSIVKVTLVSVGSATVTATAFANDLVTVLDTKSVTHGPGAGNGFGNLDPIALAGVGIARVRFETTQQVVDGFGIDDVVLSACGTMTIKPKVVVTRINTDVDPTNDGLKIAGEFINATAFAGLNPLANGARVLVENAADASRVDVTLASGAFGGKGTRGWKVNSKGTKWTFQDKTGAPANGITKMVMQDRSSKAPNQVKVSVSGKNGTYPIVAGDAPIEVTVVLGGQSAFDAGQCGATDFDTSNCTFNGKMNKLTCKQ